MAQMRIAIAAFDFSALAVKLCVFVEGQRVIGCRLEKTWPAGSGIELVFGREKRRAADNAFINAIALFF